METTNSTLSPDSTAAAAEALAAAVAKRSTNPFSIDYILSGSTQAHQHQLQQMQQQHQQMMISGTKQQLAAASLMMQQPQSQQQQQLLDQHQLSLLAAGQQRAQLMAAAAMMSQQQQHQQQQQQQTALMAAAAAMAAAGSNPLAGLDQFGASQVPPANPNFLYFMACMLLQQQQQKQQEQQLAQIQQQHLQQHQLQQQLQQQHQLAERQIQQQQPRPTAASPVSQQIAASSARQQQPQAKQNNTKDAASSQSKQRQASTGLMDSLASLARLTEEAGELAEAAAAERKSVGSRNPSNNYLASPSPLQTSAPVLMSHKAARGADKPTPGQQVNSSGSKQANNNNGNSNHHRKSSHSTEPEEAVNQQPGEAAGRNQTFKLISSAAQALKGQAAGNQLAATINTTLAKAPPELVQTQPAWVFCTRYSDRPSSGPRTKRIKSKDKKAKDPKAAADEKRPRTAFTSEQLEKLRQEFQANSYLDEKRRKDLAERLCLHETQIKIWFQNKRAKMKKQNNQPNPLRGLLVAGGLYNHSTATSDCSESYANGNEDDDGACDDSNDGDPRGPPSSTTTTTTTSNHHRTSILAGAINANSNKRPRTSGEDGNLNFSNQEADTGMAGSNNAKRVKLHHNNNNHHSGSESGTDSARLDELNEEDERVISVS